MEEHFVSDGTVRCKICDKGVSMVYMDKKRGGICGDCMREVKPPTMILVDAASTGQLYNITGEKYEFAMTIADLEKCGWHVAEMSQRKASANDSITRTSYLLKYYGNKKCGRFPMYGYWGLDACVCHLNNCISMQPPDSRAAAAINPNIHMT